ncbi:MAG: hypothetical protein ACREQW_06485 [Candidatus Binatia bacterium]
MQPKFNLDTIPTADMAALRLCCEGFVQQQNAIFAELNRALNTGGEIEVAIPVGAENEDLLQAILFFTMIVNEYRDKNRSASSGVTVIESASVDFCRLVLDALLTAAMARKRAQAAAWN